MSLGYHHATAVFGLCDNFLACGEIARGYIRLLNRAGDGFLVVNETCPDSAEGETISRKFVATFD